MSDAISQHVAAVTPELSIINEDFGEIDSPQIILAMSSNDTDVTDTSDGLRRSSRKPIPNTKYTTDYISPTISPTISRVTSPKRAHSPSTASTSPAQRAPKLVKKPRKKGKQSLMNSPNLQQILTNKTDKFTNIGTLQLPWPRYGIRSGVYEGKIYSVTQTCPLDTGLFILYFAYRTGTSEFRDLFERDTLEIYTTLRRTFQLVESDDWTTARLYWLTIHNLLDNDETGTHNIENTLTEIVFKFIQPMQKHLIRTKCSCDACPKQIRSITNSDLALV